MAHKILIIDDEKHVVSFLEDIFHDNGFQTVAAKDGDEGFELMKKEKPDLITLDLQMPNERGTKFYQRFRKDVECNKIPIVVVTGQSSPEKALKPCKIAGLVSKPFDPDVLLSVVNQALTQK
ncbi:MAG: response regulator [Deltaproteobacteria bacterium]|nr:response regulator [Deltaproteobacteria bacterium]